MNDAPLPRVTIFPDAAAFRAWLEANHHDADELWIGYYKKGVPKTAMTYAEAVEEALCFGWIDGKARRIDDEVTGQRFTPRRRTSSWSAINIAKVGELSAAGRMHPAGLRAFAERDRRRDACRGHLTAIERTLARLMRQGDRSRRVPARTAALGLHSLLEGLFQNWMLDPVAFDLVKVGTQVIDAYLAGVGVVAPKAHRQLEPCPA